MLTAAEQQIIVDDIYEWRCGGCPIRPVLAHFGLNGGIHIKVSGRRSYALNYVFDVALSVGLRAHCPACHTWRELRWNADTQSMQERPWTGFVPVINCSCEFERFAAQRKEERNG